MRFEDVVFVYHLRDERQIAWHGRLHSHPEGQYELHYFISGSGSFRNRDTVHSIEPGTLHVTAPLETHQIMATDSKRPITYYAVLLDTRDEGTRLAPGEPELVLLLEQLIARRRPLAVGTAQRFFFADLLEKSKSAKRELVMAAYHGLLAFLYSLEGGQSLSQAPSDNAHVEKALAIMQGSIEGELDLAELCDRIQLSREHFVRLFSERMGMPPMRYYSRLKIEAARAMLSSTNLRVQEISDKLGYENQFNFARAFKRVSGMAPTEYRAICLQRDDFSVAANSAQE
jgi:Transcriptional regulator containing an amidase domain and an AraC-type DNA-binding HTH domain